MTEEAEALRGIFPVLQTPFSEDGAVDETALRREVELCVAAGAHGVVFPVLGSEFQYLGDAERDGAVKAVVEVAGGRLPVVAGVAAPTLRAATEHARHAAAVGADAVIALPPYLAAATPEETLAYYEAVANAARLPVFVQHSHAGLDAAFLGRLINEIDQVQYIKEENEPSAHHISAVVAGVGSECKGVFGGALGRWMLSELHRGAAGFMPAAEVPEIYVRIWEAWQAGDRTAARELFNHLLPLINLTLLLGLPVCKTVLQRRGVFSSAAMRMPGATLLDDADHRELDEVLQALQPLLIEL